MRIILKERRVDTFGGKASDMRLVLGSRADFKNEKMALAHLV